jgi:hypothetical protein
VPFSQFANAQQIEVAVAGPADVTRLYLCKGLAQGSLNISVGPGQGQSQTDVWQFEVGPHLESGQFRRAIATAAFAGLSESEPSGGAGYVSWVIQAVIADFDDDEGKVRVSVTNQLSLYNSSTTSWETAGIPGLSYDVSILAAVAA